MNLSEWEREEERERWFRAADVLHTTKGYLVVAP